MAEIHIDSDWKKQAQEEKERLAKAEAEAKQKAAPAAAPRGAPARDREAREIPPASFASLVQTILTQALFYMGDIAARGAEPVLNLDMAKHHIDTLAVIEDKTRNNLSADEKHFLDSALYEARMRFVGLASQIASYP